MSKGHLFTNVKICFFSKLKKFCTWIRIQQPNLMRIRIRSPGRNQSHKETFNSTGSLVNTKSSVPLAYSMYRKLSSGNKWSFTYYFFFITTVGTRNACKNYQGTLVTTCVCYVSAAQRESWKICQGCVISD